MRLIYKVVVEDGSKEWWLNNKKHREEDFNKKINSCEGKVVEIDGKKYQLKLISR